MGCFHSFDLVLNPDSSWAHPSCAHHAEAEAARTRSLIILPLIQRKAKYVIFHVHQSPPPSPYVIVPLCLHFLPFFPPGVRMPHSVLLGAVAPPSSMVPPSPLPPHGHSSLQGWVQTPAICCSWICSLVITWPVLCSHRVCCSPLVTCSQELIPVPEAVMFCVSSEQFHWPFLPSSPFPAG